MIEIDVLRIIQKKLSRYIFSKGYLSWNGIRRACENIILALPEEEKKLFDEKKYPEFEIIIPLLKNGTVEVCKCKDRATLLYCMNPNINLIGGDGIQYIRAQEFYSIYRTKEYLEKNKKKYKDDIAFVTAFEPLSFLKSYPSIEQQIKSFPEHQIQINSLHFEQNLMNYQYVKKEKKDFDVGIYKLDDKVWTSPYLFDKTKTIRKISYYAEDPDSMNLSRLYVRLNNASFTKTIFEYKKDSHELICNRYSEMPILLTRALLLFEPKQLASEDFHTNHPTVPLKNISKEVIKELQRIFSNKAIIIE